MIQLLLSNSSPNIWWRVGKGLRGRHSDLLSNFGILFLNTCSLSSRIFKQIPQIIGQLADTSMSYMGIVDLGYYFSAIKKGSFDLNASFWEGDRFGVILSAIKVSVKVIDMLLTCAGFAASLSLLATNSHIARKIFFLSRPIGLIFLVIGIGMEFCDYFQNREVLVSLNETLSNPIKMARIFDQLKLILSSSLAGDSIPIQAAYSNVERNDRFAVLQILRLIEASQLKTIQKGLVGVHHNAALPTNIFLEVKRIITKNQEMKTASLGLRILGYCSMAVIRLYPNTLIASASLWIISLLWTGKTAIEKYNIEEGTFRLEKGMRNGII